jgi:choline dehydrogenase-like flavoprotein
MTYKDYPDDLKLVNVLSKQALEILEAAGAVNRWSPPINDQPFSPHSLGTCRMGSDRKSSTIDPDHRTHDIKNLFLYDGSNLVTSGRGQPIVTIQALDCRAADRINRTCPSWRSP